MKINDKSRAFYFFVFVVFITVFFGVVLFKFTPRNSVESFHGKKTKEIKYANIHFSPDKRFLAFDFCDGGCSSFVYDSKNNVFIKYLTKEGYKVANINFSPVEGRAVFLLRKISSDAIKQEEQLLVVGDFNTMSFKKITDWGGVKMYPTYFGEQNIVFWERLDYPRSSPLLNSVNIESGAVRSNFIKNIDYLFTPSAPSFFDKNNQFVFSDFGLGLKNDGIAGVTKLHNNNLFVFSMDKGVVSHLNTADLISSFAPVVAKKTGAVFFIGRQPEWSDKGRYYYDVFYHDGSSLNRLTYFRSIIQSFDITGDGKLLALALRYLDEKTPRLIIFNVENNEWSEIVHENFTEKFIYIER